MAPGSARAAHAPAPRASGASRRAGALTLASLPAKPRGCATTAYPAECPPSITPVLLSLSGEQTPAGLSSTRLVTAAGPRYRRRNGFLLDAASCRQPDCGSQPTERRPLP